MGRSKETNKPNDTEQLLKEYKKVKNQVEEIWKKIPIDLQMLIFGDDALFVNREQATQWILTPHMDLSGKSPAQAVADGEGDKVIKIIDDNRTGLPL